MPTSLIFADCFGKISCIWSQQPFSKKKNPSKQELEKKVVLKGNVIFKFVNFKTPFNFSLFTNCQRVINGKKYRHSFS